MNDGAGTGVEQTGEYRIRAGREQVWKALNDAEILGRCIPGCESIVAVDENRFVAAVTSKVGPVTARFRGEITLSELDPPRSYVLTGSGQGGAAGFARGQARVHLDAQGDETLLKYELGANIGGKLAQVGSRLVDGAARKLADDFFASFKAVMEADTAGIEALLGTEPVSRPAAKWWLWATLLVALVLIAWLLL